MNDIELQQWIDKKLECIAQKLPNKAHTEPASFSCGYNVGYKQCLLDLERAKYRPYSDTI